MVVKFATKKSEFLFFNPQINITSVYYDLINSGWVVSITRSRKQFTSLVVMFSVEKTINMVCWSCPISKMLFHAIFITVVGHLNTWPYYNTMGR